MEILMGYKRQPPSESFCFQISSSYHALWTLHQLLPPVNLTSFPVPLSHTSCDHLRSGHDCLALGLVHSANRICCLGPLHRYWAVLHLSFCTSAILTDIGTSMFCISGNENTLAKIVFWKFPLGCSSFHFSFFSCSLCSLHRTEKL